MLFSQGFFCDSSFEIPRFVHGEQSQQSNFGAIHSDSANTSSAFVYSGMNTKPGLEHDPSNLFPTFCLRADNKENFHFSSQSKNQVNLSDFFVKFPSFDEAVCALRQYKGSFTFEFESDIQYLKLNPQKLQEDLEMCVKVQ